MRSPAFPAVIALAIPFGVFGQSVLNTTPSRVVGQPSVNFRSVSPNLVEGREVLNPWAVVVDRTSSPPVLYVSDTGNNRVLGWRNFNTIQNGAPADFVLGQVDMISTQPGGPGTARTGGLSTPGGIAVDRQGNLYVMDTGNNRVLRFPKPAQSTDEVQFPDFIIGQPTLTTDTANLGGFPTAKTLALSTSSASRNGLAFDVQGNLWVTDSMNNRVLRYPASALSGGASQPDADIVLGQPDFATVTAAPTSAPQGEAPAVMNKAGLRIPAGLTIDPDGRVYVADALGRVLVYTSPATGREATRVLGVSVGLPGQPPKYEFVLGNPQGLFMIGNRLGVADPPLNRISIYDPYSEWPAETPEQPSPAIRTIIGQTSFTETRSNRGQPEPNESSLSTPIGAHYSGTELVVADYGNQRILVFPNTSAGASATRVIGQTNFVFNSPNLIDGREMFVFSGFTNQSNLSGNFSDGAGIAIDNRQNVSPRLYVADTFNNRILAYKDARLVRPGDRADLVIGQTDLNRSLVNSPSNNPTGLSDTGLFRPSGLAVDANGDLWVADSGNARVLRFPSPFEQNTPAGQRLRANLVLGQANFFQKITDATSRNMAYPFGLAFTVDGHLLVSDAIHSRVLLFRRAENGQFVSGQAASLVVGQPDFFSSGSGSGVRNMNSPRHLSTDTDDRLYVADAGNNRVLVYDRITTASNNPSWAYSLGGVNSPQGVFVSKATGEIWVGNTRGNAATRFPIFQNLAISTQSNFNIPSSAPLALTQDAFGNLYVLEGANRVSIYYNALRHQVAGNYVERALSPGAITILYPAGGGLKFSETSQAFNELPNPVPLPKVLNDLSVLINGEAAPLYYASPFQVNFLVPMNAPQSGDAEIQIVRPSTGQILAAGRLPFDRVSPALFTADGQAEGQLAALNEDNSVNSSSNPIPVGRVIQLFGTGQGFVPNAPPDGTPPSGPIATQERPRVVIGSDFVPDENILYTGLAPSLVGVWQINVRIPDRVAPSSAVDVVVQLRSVNSNTPPAGFPRQRLRTTIAVRTAQ